MPKKSAKQTDSDEDYAEAQSQPELDPGSLEATVKLLENSESCDQKLP